MERPGDVSSAIGETSEEEEDGSGAEQTYQEVITILNSYFQKINNFGHSSSLDEIWSHVET